MQKRRGHWKEQLQKDKLAEQIITLWILAGLISRLILIAKQQFNISAAFDYVVSF
ncbi:hypothetical protein RLOatenuis_7290 [Rickettsiales bacterium]|nr:hypothetical protein RLOatenuis_7290 [Rickettsiales bacterium]